MDRNKHTIRAGNGLLMVLLIILMKIGVRETNLDRYLVSVTGNAIAMDLILNCFHMWIGADQVIGSENSHVVMAERKKG